MVDAMDELRLAEIFKIDANEIAALLLPGHTLYVF